MSQKMINTLGMPLDFLWEPSFPLKWKILFLVTEAHPVSLDVQTFANLTRESRTKVRDCLKSLASQGKILRDDGKVTLVVEELPKETPESEKGLKTFQAVWGRRLKREGIPVPLRRKLMARKEATITKLGWRLPRQVLIWMDGKGALDDHSWWGRTLPKRIEASDILMAKGTELLALAGDDLLGGMTPVEALVDYLTLVTVRIERTRGKEVRKPTALMASLLSELEKGDAGKEDDALYALPATWVHHLTAYPVSERTSMGEFLTEPDDQEAEAPEPDDQEAEPDDQEAEAPEPDDQEPDGYDYGSHLGIQASPEVVDAMLDGLGV